MSDILLVKRPAQPPEVQDEKALVSGGECWPTGRNPMEDVHREGFRNRAKKTQVLTRIVCVKCGKLEYLRFIPDNPEAALCEKCFLELPKELRPGWKHQKQRR